MVEYCNSTASWFATATVRFENRRSMCVDGETVDGDGEDDVRKMEESEEEKMKKVEEKVWWGGENQKGGERVRKQRCLLWCHIRGVDDGLPHGVVHLSPP
ncbi:hypothetical protein MTR_4g026060 [Medicago truncatula]|uniref:Uncharacterized protein n=1 Tax=Medicago truncatula TaxID=3880 RepID=A0A072UI57_MEDTR|nr:hypothetical protein MTR_4g026060 [Medicago truncatula]